MTGIRELVAVLKAEVSHPRYRERWKKAQKRHPVLKRAADVQATLGILGNLRRTDVRHKDIMIRAIIAEHKAHPGPFWSTVLLLAHSPMLAGLRSRILGDTFDREDLDQLVVDAFLSVVTGFPLIEKRSHIFLRLKHVTSQYVFQVIRSRQDELKEQRQLATLSQRLADFDMFGEVESSESQQDRDEMAELLRKLAVGKEPRDNLALVIDTLIYRQKLTDYVVEHFPSDDPEQQERIYQRIKKQRFRSMQRLRGILRDAYDPAMTEEALEIWNDSNEPHSTEWTGTE